MLKKIAGMPTAGCLSLVLIPLLILLLAKADPGRHQVVVTQVLLGPAAHVGD